VVLREGVCGVQKYSLPIKLVVGVEKFTGYLPEILD